MSFFTVVLLTACVAGVFGIQCYICNSITHPDCENNYEQFLRNCPVKSFGGRKAVPPIGCRKYLQTANQETSIVRECAYLGEDVENKSNKGSAGVSRTMTQCSNRPACNPSAQLSYIRIYSVFTIPLLYWILS